MSDKLRGAIFDVLGPMGGLAVLDAYAGSGAVGLEALSRGAVLVEAIEAQASVARVTAANVKALDPGINYRLHRCSVGTWLASPSQQPPHPRYDVIVADPPYARLEPEIIDRLIGFLQPDGILVLSHSSKRAAPMLESGELVRSTAYGDSALSYYRRC